LNGPIMKEISSSESFVKVLHVVRSLKRGGGVQGWLVECLKRIDSNDVRIDFLTLNNQVGYFEELSESNSRVFCCNNHHKIIFFLREIYHIFKENKYDIVHSHCEYLDGIILSVAKACNIPVRISHAHTNVSVEYSLRNLKNTLWQVLSTKLILNNATSGVSVSQLSGRNFFGKAWGKIENFGGTLPCGIDLKPFTVPLPAKQFLNVSEIPHNYKIFGNVARFCTPKNHEFILDIINETIKIDKNVRFVFVGDGELKNKIESLSLMRGIDKYIIFLGARDDVPFLLRKYVDVFLFPSKSEGLGLALIEAQAAGLPCLYSNVIPSEVAIIPDLCHSLPLDNNPKVWAEKLLFISRNKPAISLKDNLFRLFTSKYNIEISVKNLIEYYMAAIEAANCRCLNSGKAVEKHSCKKRK